MFGGLFGGSQEGKAHKGKADSQRFVKSITSNVPYIEFTVDGHIIYANTLLLDVIGYRLEEIVGKHHNTLCFPEDVNRPEYKEFWANLARGISVNKRFIRKNKQGKPVWLAATYFPILHNGKVAYVAKVAADISEEQKHIDRQDALLNALDRSQAVIEFQPDGTIVTANKNFCSLMGYSLNEIKDKNHSQF